MLYSALVEDWPGESMVYFRELPGCFSSAPNYEEALKAAPRAVADYWKWLKANKIELPLGEDGEIRVIVKERRAATQGGPRFEADLAAPDDLEIDSALNIAAVARAELLDLYESVPPAYRNRSTSVDAWSLSEHLSHIVAGEAWYISRLADHPPPDPGAHLPSDISIALFDNAMDVELILRGLSPAEREKVFLHDGEEWTAAKVLRRMAEHLREHYPWMVAIAREVGVK